MQLTQTYKDQQVISLYGLLNLNFNSEVLTSTNHSKIQERKKKSMKLFSIVQLKREREIEITRRDAAGSSQQGLEERN